MNRHTGRLSGWIATSLLTGLLLSLISDPGAAQQATGAKVALVVGISAYDHVGFDDLKYTERDAEETAKLLRAAGYTRVVVLTSQAGKTEASQRPTLENIRRELNALLEKRTKRDTVLVALSGHGMQLETEKDSFFCPSDANPKKADTMLPLGKLSQELDDSGAGVKLLLVDACRNEPIARGAKGSPGLDGTNLPSLGKGTGILLSCSPGERSFEHESWSHGVFFYTILEGLRPGSNGRLAADLDGDGEVDFEELSRYVRKTVPVHLGKVFRGAEQTPNTVANLSGLVTVLRGAAPTKVVLKPQEPPRPVEVAPSRDYQAKKVGMPFKLILPGRFLMGSPESDGLASRYEKPQHEVTLTQPYYLGACEVTREQFEMFVNETKHQTTAEKDEKGGRGYSAKTKRFELGRAYNWLNPGFRQEKDHPIVNVSWDDAVAFCAWLTQKEGSGRTFRLPTEAEWEHACRASSKTLYCTGDDDDTLKGYANVGDQSLRLVYGEATWAAFWDDRYSYTAPVGRFTPNAWGLCDMHGNVWEWCADGRRTYEREPRRDPVGPTKTTEERILRGGSWYNQPRLCRSAGREVKERSYCSPNLGFRVAFTAPEAP